MGILAGFISLGCICGFAYALFCPDTGDDDEDEKIEENRMK